MKLLLSILFTCVFFVYSSMISLSYAIDCNIETKINSAAVNSTVTLDKDCKLTKDLTISKSITLNGNQKTISGDYRILIKSTGVKIQNITLDGLGVKEKDTAGSAAIEISEKNVTITNSTIKNSARNGIGVKGDSSDTKISGNTISGSKNSGIYFGGNSSGTVDGNNKLEGNHDGILIL